MYRTAILCLVIAAAPCFTGNADVKEHLILSELLKRQTKTTMK